MCELYNHNIASRYVVIVFSTDYNSLRLLFASIELWGGSQIRIRVIYINSNIIAQRCKASETNRFKMLI